MLLAQSRLHNQQSKPELWYVCKRSTALVQLQDHVSDNNDSDWQPSPSRSKRSEASGRQAGSIRSVNMIVSTFACVVL